MNQEEVKYATGAIERFKEPARDEAVRLASELIAETWEKFWENHIRKLSNYLMNPENALASYKHGISLNIVLGVDGVGLVMHPEISFGFKEKYVGAEVEVNGQQRLPFDEIEVSTPDGNESPVTKAVLDAAKKAGVKVKRGGK
jgi:hypothetical protein